jgi:lantibiotic biosynthesis protein
MTMTVPVIPGALATASQIAGTLDSPGILQRAGDQGDARYWPQSLAGGAVGIALLHVERARSGHGDWQVAHAWLASAASGSVTAASNAHLFFGAPALDRVTGCLQCYR